MRITNHAGLPEPVYNLIANDEYSRGDADISVTQLIDSARIRVLYKKHDQEMEQEASNLLAAVLGKAFHKAIEAATTSGLAEHRFSIEVAGWKLSGGIDHFENSIICDYKTANVFKCVYSKSGAIREWENQLNVYAHILREKTCEIKGLKIFVLFKDWNKRDFGSAKKREKLWAPWRQAGYPDKAWAYVDVPLWSPEKAKAYVEERIKIHQVAEALLPNCSGDEIWSGARCLNYCQAAPFCLQFKNQKRTLFPKEEE